jgi:hypothetical protein
MQRCETGRRYRVAAAVRPDFVVVLRRLAIAVRAWLQGFEQVKYELPAKNPKMRVKRPNCIAFLGLSNVLGLLVPTSVVAWLGPGLLPW